MRSLISFSTRLALSSQTPPTRDPKTAPKALSIAPDLGVSHGLHLPGSFLRPQPTHSSRLPLRRLKDEKGEGRPVDLGTSHAPNRLLTTSFFTSRAV